MRYLYHRLVVLREGCKKGSFQSVRWLHKEISQIMPVARYDAPEILPKLVNISQDILDEKTQLNVTEYQQIDAIIYDMQMIVWNKVGKT